jgi:hypothetical protein
MVRLVEIKVRLRTDEWDQLTALSLIERRDPQQQAAYMIARGLATVDPVTPRVLEFAGTPDAAA